ncbi:MAG: polysaccharide biosynthesis C-terminal domain-containing protein [Oscillospiraceae bacterium]|nr:polysaccharide biosynthesis C-terminal domain-containing protein [Oscillospiraceae bacterium]
MDRYKKLASNTIILALGQFGSKLLVIIMMRFYTGTLGADGYGAVGVITNAGILLMAIVTLSVGESVIRFGLDSKYDKGQVFSIGFTTTITGLLVFIPFIPILGLVNFLADYRFLIYLYVFTGSIKSVCALFVRSTGNVRLFAIDGIFTTVVNVLLNILFLRGFGMGVLGYVLSVVLADLASIIFLFYFGRLSKYLRLFGIDKQLRRFMYRFSIPMIPTAVMWWITGVSSTFFITAMLGIDQAGVYKAAYTFPNIIALVSGIFSQAWNMSAITEKNSRTIAKFYSDVFGFYQSVIYVIAAAMLLMIRFLLNLMAVGADFEGVFRYSPFIIVAVVFSCFSTFMGSVYVASKKSVRSMLTAMSGAVINIVLNLLLIPILGINGAALSTLLSYILVFSVRVIDTRPLVFMDLKPFKMGANLTLLGLMAVIVMMVQDTNIYYISLSVMFVLIIALNYRAALTALRFLLKRKGSSR